MANLTLITKELKKRLNAFDFESAVNFSDNEAKTRMYLVEPFFEMLGYNRGFENGSLVPEYDADFANLKGKKVDYAILFRNRPEIIVEVKKSSTRLTDRHLRQLNEYFTYTTDSRIGILTNGVEFYFYCRNDNGAGGLHPTPFYQFSFENVDGSEVDRLAEFYASHINTTSIVEQAQELFFIESFEEGLYNELAKPSKDFIKAIYERMGGKRLTSGIEAQIRDLIGSVTLQSAVDRLMVEESQSANSGVVTTADELKAYHAIKTILAQHKKIETQRIGYRDAKSKFCILVDNNIRNKVCDLYITPTTKRIEIDGEKFEIPDIDSIVKLKRKLIDKALTYFQ